MDWTSISHFLHMDGHGAYVWAAYGMWVLVIANELFGLKRRRAKAAQRLIREARALRSTREI
jgi:heme exporter protein ccmD